MTRAEYLATPSVLGNIVHARRPDEKVAMCGQRNVRWTQTRFAEDGPYACKKCLRVIAHLEDGAAAAAGAPTPASPLDEFQAGVERLAQATCPVKDADGSPCALPLGHPGVHHWREHPGDPRGFCACGDRALDGQLTCGRLECKVKAAQALGARAGLSGVTVAVPAQVLVALADLCADALASLTRLGQALQKLAPRVPPRLPRRPE